jgi:Raf kinase inhibitor-like YbhB/YbcL family protein
MNGFVIRSPVFENNKLVPSKYTCDGEGINPPLTIEGIPEKTKSLTLLLEDPDAPAGLWIHWVVWNIQPTSTIKENSVPGTEGLNTDRKHGYHPPCPPSGTHRYIFKVFALDNTLNLGSFAEKDDVETAMQGHVLAEGKLIGLYRRTR